MKLKLLILILALQTAWILGTVVIQERALTSGKLVMLETRPVDPRDLLRGDFHRAGGPRGAGEHAEADEEAEREIRALLTEAFPNWGYLGEETGARPASDREAHVWLVDPNDGTKWFLKGMNGSAVSVGLLHQ